MPYTPVNHPSLKSVTFQKALNLPLLIQNGHPVLPGNHGQVQPLRDVRTLVTRELLGGNLLAGLFL